MGIRKTIEEIQMAVEAIKSEGRKARTAKGCKALTHTMVNTE